MLTCSSCIYIYIFCPFVPKRFFCKANSRVFYANHIALNKQTYNYKIFIMKYTVVAACLASCTLAMHNGPMDTNRMANVNGAPFDTNRMAANNHMMKDAMHRRAMHNAHPMDVNRMMAHDKPMDAAKWAEVDRLLDVSRYPTQESHARRHEKQGMDTTVRYAAYDTNKPSMSKYVNMDRLVDLARMVVKEGNNVNARAETPMDISRWAEMQKLLDTMRMSMGKSGNFLVARTDKPIDVVRMLNTEGKTFDANKMANLNLDKMYEFVRLATNNAPHINARAGEQPMNMNRMVEMMHDSIMTLAHELYNKQMETSEA